MQLGMWNKDDYTANGSPTYCERDIAVLSNWDFELGPK